MVNYIRKWMDLEAMKPGVEPMGSNPCRTLRWSLTAAWLLGVGGLAAFLLLRSEPETDDLAWMPMWISKWCDAHPDFRTLPMAFGVALVPSLLLLPERVLRRRVLTGIAVTLVLAECIQVFLPHRSFTWPDIFYSLLAVALAACIRPRHQHHSLKNSNHGPAKPLMTPDTHPVKQESILGLPFYNGTVAGALEETLSGALVVAPSGPNLANELSTSPAYRAGVQKADLVLTDSAVMVAIYRLATGRSVVRHSGLKYLKALLERPELRAERGVFWVMPSGEESELIGKWLRSQGLQADDENVYVAPFYPAGPIEDEILLQRVQKFGPRVIVINLAGGKQEILGAWLAAAKIPSHPGIVCTGAAVAFLAGTQADIPDWADRYGLGWLFRCISSPRKFVPRYWRALPLIRLVLKYRDQLPPERAA